MPFRIELLSHREERSMGEAKRRRQSDPTFGTKKKDSILTQLKASFGKISTLELALWTAIIISSVTTAIWSFTR